MWRIAFLVVGLIAIATGIGIATVNLGAGVVIVVASLVWIATIK